MNSGSAWPDRSQARIHGNDFLRLNAACRSAARASWRAMDGGKRIERARLRQGHAFAAASSSSQQGALDEFSHRLCHPAVRGCRRRARTGFITHDRCVHQRQGSSVLEGGRQEGVHDHQHRRLSDCSVRSDLNGSRGPEPARRRNQRPRCRPPAARRFRAAGLWPFEAPHRRRRGRKC